MRLLIGAAMFAAMLTSCVSITSRAPAELGLESPSMWTGALTDSGQVDSLWWQAFRDDILNDVIAEALRQNYDLKIAAANVSAAAAQAKIAGAPLYPQINASASGSRRKQIFVGFPFGNPGGGIPGNLSNSFGISLDTSWEMDLWGRIRAGKIGARADFDAAQADLHAARLSLSGQVTKAWFSAIESRRQMELAQATVDNLRRSYEQVQRRYESGLRPPLDLRLSLSSLASAEATLSQRQIQHDITLRQLEIMLGRYPAASLQPAAVLPAISAPVPAGIPADLLAQRPDLVAASRRLVAADAGVSGAKRALFPQINLTASGGTTTDQLKDILNGDFSVWSVAAGILQPLFQGGKLRANVGLAQSRSEAAQAQFLKSILNAFGEVETALNREHRLLEQETSLRTASEQSIAARELAEEQYARGVGAFLNMLDAQRSAYENESRLLSANRERLEARVDLYLALGGGFDINNIAL